LSLNVTSVNYEFRAENQHYENSRKRSIALPSVKMPFEVDGHSLRPWIAQADRVPAAALRQDWQAEGTAFEAIVSMC
jgi:hypothetical protein